MVWHSAGSSGTDRAGAGEGEGARSGTERHRRGATTNTNLEIVLQPQEPEGARGLLLGRSLHGPQWLDLKLQERASEGELSLGYWFAAATYIAEQQKCTLDVISAWIVNCLAWPDES